MRDKPHVIILMADQLRYDVLGQGFTPHIDSIADQGVRFDRAYTACPLCVPARGAFFTGTWPNHNGSLINPWEPADAAYGSVKSDIVTLYTLMEDRWDSLHSGKQHLYTAGGKLEERKDSKTRWLSTQNSYKDYLHTNQKPLPGGPKFRAKVPEMVGGQITRVNTYSNAWTGCYEFDEAFYYDSFFTEKALEGMRERDVEKPMLLNMMFLAPHPPLQIPEPWYGAVKNEAFELPENVGVYDSRQSPLQMYHMTGIIGSRYDKEHWIEAWRVYLGLVSMLDSCVGRILDELKAQGIYDDSLILFTSDHGEMLGSHSLFQKMCMYEEAIRVPLFMKFPGGCKTFVNSVGQVVSHVDVLPTLCQYLDLSVSHQMDGHSLLGLMTGTDQEVKDAAAFVQFDGNGARSNFQRCIILGRYKLIVDLFKDEVFYELYDLEQDVQERVNLMFDDGFDEMAVHMASLLARHMVGTGDLLTCPACSPEEFRSKYSRFPVK